MTENLAPVCGSQVSAHADPISRSALACDGLSAPRCVPACPNSATRHISRHSQFIPGTQAANISQHTGQIKQSHQHNDLNRKEVLSLQ